MAPFVKIPQMNLVATGMIVIVLHGLTPTRDFAAWEEILEGLKRSLKAYCRPVYISKKLLDLNSNHRMQSKEAMK